MVNSSTTTPSRRLARFAGLLLAGGVALAYFYARSPAEDGAYLPCLVKRWTGCYCAGCGGQRALHALLHGRVAEAAGHNLLLVLMAPLGLAWLAAAWIWPERVGRFWQQWGGQVLAAVFLAAAVFTLLRNLPWPSLHVLAP